MTKEELLSGIRETWDNYGEVENPGWTTEQLRKADDILDDLERLITDGQ